MGRQRPLTLNCAVNRIWNLNCRITGALQGTSSRLSPEPEAAGSFGRRTAGQLSLFPRGKPGPLECPRPGARSQSILGSPVERAGRQLTRILSGEAGGYRCLFQKNRAAPSRSGRSTGAFWTFVRQFLEAERQLGFQLPIRGRDAYAPMRSVCSPKNKRFIRELEGLLDEIQIGVPR